MAGLWACLAMTRHETRRGFLGWLLAIAGMSALYASSYKSVAGLKAGAIKNYPAALKRALNLQDLTSPSGYLASTVFGIPLILLVTIYSVNAAMHAVAGDEESGALDLVLSYPVTRRVLVLARAASIAISLTVMGVVVFLIVLAVRAPAGLAVGAADLGATCLTWVLLGWCLAGFALLISAASGRRAATLGISATVALVAYLCDSFLPLVDHLGWIRNISPYYWFVGGNPLRNGIQLAHCGLLGGVAVLSAILAVAAMERRDIRV